MATEKEEIILDFKVEQGDAIAELEKLKRLIFQNKQEQLALTKAFKAGQLTAEEYAKESVRVENALKRQQKAYSDTQKAVLGHKSKIDELIKSNNNLSKTNQALGNTFKEAAGNINIAGVNVGSLTTKLASFANPATAAVGIVSALGAAYARSTIGAKDLEFAQNQLSTAITITTNAFASLFSSAEDGQGLFSKLLGGLLTQISPTVAALSQLAAFNQERLEDLGRAELEIRDKINDRLETNQQLLTDLQSEQQTYNDKIGITNQIISNLRTNESELLDILKEELSILQQQLKIDEENDAIKTSIAQKVRDISNIEKDTEKRVQAIQRIEQNITEEENKRLALLREDARIRSRIAGGRTTGLQAQGNSTTGVDSEATLQNAQQGRILEREKIFQDARVSLTEQAIDRQREAEQRYTNFVIQQQNARLEAATSIFGALANLFDQGSDEQKTFALLSLGADTAQAIGSLTANSEANPANAFTFGGAGITQYATGIVRILANIAAAKQYLGFKRGGYTGDGNPHDVAGVVHKKEVVWNAEDVNLAGGPTIVNAMRPTARRRHSRGGGYYDGGIVAKGATNEINNQLSTINAIKNMPEPVVSVVEITKTQRKVNVKENISKR